VIIKTSPVTIESSPRRIQWAGHGFVLREALMNWAATVSLILSRTP
jgi:hypothetical protein